MFKYIRLGIFVIVYQFLSCTGPQDRKVESENLKLVSIPETQDTNKFYVGNRPPLLKNPLIKLPTGTITPKGWLLKQLELGRDGMVGRLDEISKWCKFEGNAWVSKDGEGHSHWQEMPYWLRGLTDLGYVLKDEKVIAKAKKWIEGILTTQREDGYFGPEVNRKEKDLLSNMLVLNILQSCHEATGDERVLKFLTNYFKWQLDLKESDFLALGKNYFLTVWQKTLAADNLESVQWLYNRTGEKWLLELGDKIHRNSARWDEGVEEAAKKGLNCWHGVNICQGFKEPALYYQQSKNKKHIDATYKIYKTVKDRFGQFPGGMFASDENCRFYHQDPRQGSETCAMVEFIHSFHILLSITGDPIHADRCEDVAFNSFPASVMPNWKGLHYLTGANMVQLDKEDHSPGIQNGKCMLAFSPFEEYRCCQHNVGIGWPYYTGHLWMATHDNGLASLLYSHSDVKAKVGDGTEVTVKESTDYPFDEVITFTIETPKAVQFPIYLRIPQWCEDAKVEINDQAYKVSNAALKYIRINRQWSNGDQIKFTVPFKLGLTEWPQTRAVSVNYGPLSFSLKIGEKWVRYGGTDEWPTYEVFPTTPWNYGLVPKLKSFRVVKKKMFDRPWEPDKAPIDIIAFGKKIPNWTLDPYGLVSPLTPGPIKSDEPEEEITLLPMGCVRLRISAFPVVDKVGNEWKCVLMKHRASFLWITDNVMGLSDGVIPKSSNDLGVQRYTWWGRKGTVEWVTCEFANPQKVSGIEVYWFDETGSGHCRLPESWKVYYLSGAEWKEVTSPTEYGVKLDTFNVVKFDVVETRGLKVEVKLQKDFSAGILEIKVDYR